MGYGPQDWELLPGIYNPGADPRVWIHKACGERLEFPDDKHRCPQQRQPGGTMSEQFKIVNHDADDVLVYESGRLLARTRTREDADRIVSALTAARELAEARSRVQALEAALEAEVTRLRKASEAFHGEVWGLLNDADRIHRPPWRETRDALFRSANRFRVAVTGSLIGSWEAPLARLEPAEPVAREACSACEDGWGRTQDHACALGTNGGIGRTTT